MTRAVVLATAAILTGLAVGYIAALPMVARRVRLAGGHWLAVTRCAGCTEAA